MALDINQMSGLFTNPADLRRSRIDEIMKQQQGLSQLGGSMSGLLGQVAGSGGIMGSMLAEGIAGATGLKTAQERQAEAASGILKNLDPNDSKSMFAAAKALQQQGLTKSAFQLLTQANEQKTREDDIKFRQEKFDFEKSTKETELGLREQENEAQMRNLDIQRDRLTFLQDQDQRDADLKQEDRETLEFARINFADELRMSDKPEHRRMADLVESGAMKLADAYEKIYPTSSKLLAGDRQAIREVGAEGYTADAASRKALGLAEKFVALDPTGGALGSVYSTFKDVVGGQDAVSMLKTDFTNMRNAGIIQSLPPGPASDKDIKILSEGFPDANWNATQVTEWLMAYSRAKAVEAKYHQGRAKWMSDHGGDDSKWADEWEKIRTSDEFIRNYEQGAGGATGGGGQTISYEEAINRARANAQPTVTVDGGA
jgi:hypothetical protein